MHNIKGESQPRSGKETAATDESGGGEQAFLLGDMSRQCVHQVRGQAVIGFQTDRAQALADSLHLRWRCAGFDDGGHERRESRRSPSALWRKLPILNVLRANTQLKSYELITGSL